MERDVHSVAHSSSVSTDAYGGSTSRYHGQWVMTLGQRNFLVVQLSETEDGLIGTLSFPERFSTLGSLFFNISSTISTFPLTRMRVQDGALCFSVKNGCDGREYVMSLKDSDSAFLRYSGSPFESWKLRKVQFTELEKVAIDFEKNRAYSHNDWDDPDPEIQRMFEGDQAAALPNNGSEKLPAQDSHPAASIRNLLAAGSVRCGLDFERAAFILHHSGNTDDYLLAHTLALIAVSKGNARAVWIAAATLDRYLQAVGRPQIYGTQFDSQTNGLVTQEPYDQDLVSDDLRRHLGVPPLSMQQEQMQKSKIQQTNL